MPPVSAFTARTHRRHDIVRGTVAEQQANITVNGIAGSVVNRSYLVENVPLNPGENTLTISASDIAGNSKTIQAKVHYVPVTGPRIEAVGGQGQIGTIRSRLSAPLQVKLLNAQGQAVANKEVIFRVIKGDGVVGLNTASESSFKQAAAVQTDADGLAGVAFVLGSRAGLGIHHVRATSVGFNGEVLFTASANPQPPDKITVNSGNNQRGGIRQPLGQPFVVAVLDAGANVVEGVPVEFSVTQGSGSFQNGQTTYITTTDSDGRATAQLTLGPEIGRDVQRVSARILNTPGTTPEDTPPSPEAPIPLAGFTASGFLPGDPGKTQISGVVLDNQDTPLPSVRLRLDGVPREAVTNAQGQFTMTHVPVGPLRLLIDGHTTTAPGEWPTLSYDIITVAGVDNALPAPIYLVPLNVKSAKLVGAEDVTLTLPEIPGFGLKVKKGSVTFPDGGKQGQLSVTVVNSSKVPMPPPNGMQPQLIVTIQPTGTRFDAPAALTLPNVDGHAAGSQVEMYSYDHDLEEFVTIGLGTVSQDGKTLTSNPGTGVIKAGWHCGSQPNGGGCTHQCKNFCEQCNASCNCVPDPGKEKVCCPKQAAVCLKGNCTAIQLTIDALQSPDNFLITAEPRMPQINATATIFPPEFPIEWEAEIKFTSPGNNCTGGPTFNSPKISGSGLTFSPTFGDFYGGEVTLTAKNKSCEVEVKRTTLFAINASNPSKKAIREVLGDASAPFDKDDHRRIACKESGQKQFVNYMPYFALGGGADVGIMQICHLRQAEHLWNWKKNVEYGLRILQDSLRFANSFPGKIRESFPDATLDFLPNDLGVSSSEAFRRAAIHAYNAGTNINKVRYWQWNNTDKRWEAKPLGGTAGYVDDVLAQSPLCGDAQ